MLQFGILKRNYIPFATVGQFYFIANQYCGSLLVDLLKELKKQNREHHPPNLNTSKSNHLVFFSFLKKIGEHSCKLNLQVVGRTPTQAQ
jgi:hypothetical protein